MWIGRISYLAVRCGWSLTYSIIFFVFLFVYCLRMRRCDARFQEFLLGAARVHQTEWWIHTQERTVASIVSQNHGVPMNTNPRPSSFGAVAKFRSAIVKILHTKKRERKKEKCWVFFFLVVQLECFVSSYFYAAVNHERAKSRNHFWVKLPYRTLNAIKVLFNRFQFDRWIKEESLIY